MTQMTLGLWGRRLASALLFGAVPFAIACDDGDATSPRTPVVTQVVVSPETSSLHVGDTIRFSARAFDADGNELAPTGVTWSTSREAVATISALGTASAVSAGDATVRATIGSIFGTAQLSVTLAPVATVELSLTDLVLIEGDVQTLAATAKDAAGRVLEGRTVTWSMSEPTVASVTDVGTITALSAGKTTVRATIENVFVESVVTVQRATADRIELSAGAITIEEHESKQLTAVVKDAGGRVLDGRTVTWTSDAPTIATVDAVGQVTALQPGQAKVTASAEGKSASAEVTVSRAAVASIVIFPSAMTLEVGESRQLVAGLKDAHGHSLEGRTVQWSVVGAASVTPSGVITGLRNGYLTVTAASEGVTASTGGTVILGEVPDFDLVYHRVGTSNASELFVLPLAGGAAPTKLNAGNVSRTPSPSPNGSRVAFAVSMTSLTGERIDDIFAVDRSGLNMRRLTDAPGYDDAPDWSPSGDRIVYRHYEPDVRSDIWLMNADGTAPVNLTADMPATGLRSEPAWSRDGSRIAFAQYETIAGVTTASIWTMRADGSDKRQVTSSATGFDMSPTWSPDGLSLAFVRYYSGDADITIVHLADGRLTRLQVDGREASPAWSPDGSVIAFVRASAYDNIYTMRPDGTQLRLRTVDVTWGGGLSPAWITRH